MPWKETCPMEQRVAMVGDWLKNESSIMELSKMYGVSRVTIYKWLNRFKAEGPAGFKERSRAPRQHPNAVPPEMVQMLISARLGHPRWGPKKIRSFLSERYHDEEWPALSTMSVIFKREGLVKPRRIKHSVESYSQPFLECDCPNKVWSADFKGQFRTKDGKLCYPLTITDNFSRFILLCRGLERPTHDQVRPWFESTFRRYGLPEAIRTDNGSPFASVGLRGLSRLSAWFIKLGIRPERIAKAHPEQNGRHERMHRTLKEATATPPHANLTEQQKAFNNFVEEYNFDRPHEALAMKKPAAVYEFSKQAFTSRTAPMKYGSEVIVRPVRNSGEICWKGKRIYISQALSGERIGLRQLEAEQNWEIFYGFQKLGILDDYSCTIKV
jgi:transposase InsO family protein